MTSSEVFQGFPDAVPFALWPQRTLPLSDRTYVVREAAATRDDAEPGVFIHGLGGSADNWTDLMGLLRPEIDAIAPDLNGFGESPPPRDGDYSPAGHARGVAALLEARFPGRRAHVFGNSLGGAVAVQLAARRPDLVASLTLVSPALPWRRPMRSNVHLPVIGLPLVGELAFRRYLDLPAAQRVQATVNLSFHDPSIIPPFRFDAAVEMVGRRDTYPYTRDAFLRSLRGLMATYLDVGPRRPWELARSVSVPTLLVYGRNDKLVDPAVAFRVTKEFRDSEVVILHNCGHVAQMEHGHSVAMAWRESIPRRVPATSL